MNIHLHRARYRSLMRARYGKFIKWLKAIALKLSGTGAGTTVTFLNTTNTVSLAAHEYTNGQGPFVFKNEGGALPSGVSEGVLYWINVITANTFTLHPSNAQALGNKGLIKMTDNGTGTSKIYRGANADKVFSALLKGHSASTVSKFKTADNL